MDARALRCWRRLEAAGLQVEVRELPEPAPSAAAAANALGCEPGRVLAVQLFVVKAKPLLVLHRGDRTVDPALLGEGAAPARPDQVRSATGYAAGGLPPLGHDRLLPTVVDEDVPGAGALWCFAGTAQAVFEVEAEALLAALPHAAVRPVGTPRTD